MIFLFENPYGGSSILPHTTANKKAHRDVSFLLPDTNATILYEASKHVNE
jgi:hypothetical protein